MRVMNQSYAGCIARRLVGRLVALLCFAPRPSLVVGGCRGLASARLHLAPLQVLFQSRGQPVKFPLRSHVGHVLATHRRHHQIKGSQTPLNQNISVDDGDLGIEPTIFASVLKPSLLGVMVPSGEMMDYQNFFATALESLKSERRYRVFADIERLAGRFPDAIWHGPAGPKPITVWCSNDYLGMGQNRDVTRAMVETAWRLGTGAGGTRNISGNSHAIVDLEAELADLHRKQAALVFTSGYVSNQTGISTLAKLIPDCLIVSDALNHNSMIEGVRQSGCEKVIFRHNDLA
ncbi:MAG: hemA, partial [Microvirga sp.]|nr:hemA [Microvirga sp.]